MVEGEIFSPVEASDLGECTLDSVATGRRRHQAPELGHCCLADISSLHAHLCSHIYQRVRKTCNGIDDT